MLRPQVMEIHQVVVTASPGDAITSAAFEVRRLLRRDGRSSNVYARFIDPMLLGEVLPLDTFPAPRQDVAILYHSSIGQAEVTGFLLHRPEPLAMLYHNMSPAEPFPPPPQGLPLLAPPPRRRGGGAGSPPPPPGPAGEAVPQHAPRRAVRPLRPRLRRPPRAGPARAGDAPRAGGAAAGGVVL